MVADDHELVRRGLAALVNAEEDMECCAEVPCTDAALDAAIRCQPDVVVIDISLSRGEGLALIQRIRNYNTRILIVAVAMSDRPGLEDRIRDAGAAEFVVKTDVAARVLEAIRRTRRKQLERNLEAVAEQPPRPAPVRNSQCLDAEERAIVEMIGQGIPTRAIAVRLKMSVATVEAYRRRIRGKLNFPTATQLVQFCVRWVERKQPSTPRE